MTDEEKQILTRLRDGLILERESAIRAIDARLKPKIDAYSLILSEVAAPAPRLTPPPRRVIAPVVPNRFASETLFDAVKEGIANIVLEHGEGATFSSVSLFEYVKAHYPEFAEVPSDLSNALWRLRGDEKIEVVSQGSGRVASVYRVKTEATA